MKPRRFQRPPRTVPGSSEDILAFLDAHGVQDKDQASDGSAKRAPSKLPIQKGPHGALRLTLDLHGQTSEEAARKFRAALGFCRERGIRELLVIHGYGVHSAPAEGPVLKSLVREMLENELSDRVRDFRGGLPREGGEGVTLVYLT